MRHRDIRRAERGKQKLDGWQIQKWHIASSDEAHFF
jgi:hypothetical protein